MGVRSETWRKKNSLSYINSKEVIKPQFAVQRLYELTKAQDVFITTEVGQHQMWAAQHYKFDKPNRWMTSGGLGTMGYGLPAAVGVQVANPDKLVIDIAGEASVLMTMQEMSTAVQYKLPIKIFILNNEYMGMVRQWQELLHEKNYSESYTAALPDFVKLAEAYGCVGIRANKPDELDGKIEQMLSVNKPVIFDCVVDKTENCYPMIPSGKPHNQMLLGKQDDEEDEISEEGKGFSLAMVKSAYSFATKKEKSENHIIVVWVDNEAGVLARVVGLFSGRGYNIDSLAVAEVDKKKEYISYYYCYSRHPTGTSTNKIAIRKTCSSSQSC